MTAQDGNGLPDGTPPAETAASPRNPARNRTRLIIPDPAAGGESTRAAWNTRLSVWEAGKRNGGFGIRHPKHGPTTTTLRTHFNYICGDKALRRMTEDAQRALAEHGRKSPEYEAAKSLGRAPTFAGTFKGPTCRIDGFQRGSGLLLIDQDELGAKGIDPTTERNRIFENRAVALSYIGGKSGDGVHAAVAVSPIPTSNEENHAAWRAVVSVLGLSELDGNDPAVKNINRVVPFD